MQNVHRQNHILPQIAWSLLEQHPTDGSKVPDELLQSLHSVFGNAYADALEWLDNGKFVEFTTKNQTRSVLRLTRRNEHYSLFPNINYCNCDHFQQVLQENCLTCSHVLAAKLAQIYHKMDVEVLGDGQITDMLNDELILFDL